MKTPNVVKKSTISEYDAMNYLATIAAKHKFARLVANGDKRAEVRPHTYPAIFRGVVGTIQGYEHIRDLFDANWLSDVFNSETEAKQMMLEMIDHQFNKQSNKLCLAQLVFNKIKKED